MDAMIAVNGALGHCPIRTTRLFIREQLRNEANRGSFRILLRVRGLTRKYWALARIATDGICVSQKEYSGSDINCSFEAIYNFTDSLFQTWRILFLIRDSMEAG